jgi:hypothetical protein
MFWYKVKWDKTYTVEVPATDAEQAVRIVASQLKQLMRDLDGDQVDPPKIGNWHVHKITKHEGY